MQSTPATADAPHMPCAAAVEHYRIKSPQQRLAEAQSCMHWLFENRPAPGAARREATRVAVHNTRLAGKQARALMLAEVAA